MAFEARHSGCMIMVASVLAGCQPEAESHDRSGHIEIGIDEVHTLPTPETLARIVDLQPIGNERVWVLNSVEPFFILLERDGVAQSFGVRGGGPQEFDDPINLVSLPNGDTWTFDNLRKAFRPISDRQSPDLPLATDWRLVSFENAGMGMVATAPWLQSRGGDFLVARKRASAPPSGGLGIWQADIYAVTAGPEGPLVARSLAVPDLLGDPGERYPGATILLPHPLWAACEDGGFGLYDPLLNSIRRFGSNGVERSPIRLGAERNLTVSFDRLFGMIYRLFSELRPGGQAPDSLQMRSMLQQQFEQARGAFADVFPEYSDLRCTEGGTFWLQPYAISNGRFERSAQWTRYDEDGSSTTISLPGTFNVHRIVSDQIWGTTTDSLGVSSVAWLNVKR